MPISVENVENKKPLAADLHPAKSSRATGVTAHPSRPNDHSSDYNSDGDEMKYGRIVKTINASRKK